MPFDILQVMSSVWGKREIKTPMAFYTRALWVIGAVVVAPLYSAIDSLWKVTFVLLGVGCLIAMVVWVSVFSWMKPEHLLYGAEVHFEKWKMAYGTERGLASPTQLASPAPNPQQAQQPAAEEE